MTNITKNIVIAVIVIVVIFTAFKLLVPKKEEPKTSPVSTTASVKVNTLSETREAASTLQKIKNIKVDTSIFSNKSFNSLKDFRVNILPEAVGRTNPFAPIK